MPTWPAGQIFFLKGLGRHKRILAGGTGRSRRASFLSKTITPYQGVIGYVWSLSEMGRYDQFGLPCGVFLARAFFFGQKSPGTPTHVFFNVFRSLKDQFGTGIGYMNAE